MPNLSASLDNIGFNIKFWRKRNLRQSRFCFRLSQDVPEWNNNEWSKFILFFAIQVPEENLVFIFSKYLKEAMNGILNGGKALRERILKLYLRLWNTLFWISIYKMYVWKNFSFLQKSLKAYLLKLVAERLSQDPLETYFLQTTCSWTLKRRPTSLWLWLWQHFFKPKSILANGNR